MCSSAAVITGITTQIAQTAGALNALLQLITSAVVAAGLLTGLLVIDAGVALAAAALFGSAYAALAIIARQELRRNGQKILEVSNQQLKALQEGLGAIRDVLLDGSQPTYIRSTAKRTAPSANFRPKMVVLDPFHAIRSRLGAWWRSPCLGGDWCGSEAATLTSFLSWVLWPLELNACCLPCN